jgi:hypothetical protein
MKGYDLIIRINNVEEDFMVMFMGRGFNSEACMKKRVPLPL